MKKLFVIAVALLAMVGCKSKQEDPALTQVVKFNVGRFDISQESFAKAPAAEATPVSPTAAGLTDLWVFEGTELLAHQTSKDENFGSPEIELTYGQHAITFVGSAVESQAFTEGVWSGKDAKDCFGYVHNVKVTSTTGEQNVVLTRCYYAVQWVSEDKVPTNAASVEVTVSNYRKTLLSGLNGGEIVSKKIDAGLSKYIGSVLTVSAYGFTAAYGTEEIVHTTYTIKDANKNVIYQHEKDVPILSGRATIIKGNMFGTPASAAINVNNADLTKYEIKL